MTCIYRVIMTLNGVVRALKARVYNALTNWNTSCDSETS
jgi:hypothetical protein